ncbi:MAG: hypothetical protein IKC73_00180, partial [Clostridia bacterium]|nr:hypothetical protein [Clostridia bacterium]
NGDTLGSGDALQSGGAAEHILTDGKSGVSLAEVEALPRRAVLERRCPLSFLLPAAVALLIYAAVLGAVAFLLYKLVMSVGVRRFEAL